MEKQNRQNLPDSSKIYSNLIDDGSAKGTKNCIIKKLKFEMILT